MPDKTVAVLVNRLQAIRERNGWSWTKLGVEIGLGTSTVYRLARGDYNNKMHTGTIRLLNDFVSKHDRN